MGEQKVRTREKKQRTGRKHETKKANEYYEVSGDSLKRKKQSCPRCGPGTFLAEHKDRKYCGKCGYTEIQKGGQPAPEAPKEEPKQEEPAEAPAEEKAEGAPAEAEAAEGAPAEAEASEEKKEGE
jgi:small subunit ribosomal protein S27Ae